jgi:hypothetical protein
VLLIGGIRKKLTSTNTQKKKVEQQKIGYEPHSSIRGFDIDVKGGENNGKTITHC